MIKPEDLIAKFQYTLDNKWGYIWGTAGIMWTEAKQKSATREQTKQFGAQWIGHYVSDCSGLFYWAFKQLGGYMYHGSNSMYDRYCTSKGKLKNGKRTDGASLLPGTALFTGSEGSHGHVGLYIGNGEVIEAQGTKAGVIKSKASNSKWTYWGEMKGVDYSGTQPEPEPGQDRPTLKKGSRGVFVTLLQTMLVNRGYDVGTSGIDGVFGQATEKAVKSFQKAAGLAADGIVGRLTWEALDEQNEPVTYTVTISGLNAEQAAELEEKYPGATVKKG